MITIKYKNLKLVSVLSLALMTMIFCAGWLKAFIGIPIAILMLVLTFISCKKPDDRELKIKISSLIFIVACVLLWAFLAGQGGFFTQKNDHWARNAIFRDLINNSWPVRFGGENDESLVYYIGHWLVPSLFGKLGLQITGNVETGFLFGRIALLLWTSLLIVLAILNVMFKVNANSFKKLFIIMVVFMFFSGMDAVVTTLNPQLFANHIEWWAHPFQYSSMTTQLFWVFNQAVPLWLAMSVLLNEKDESNFAFIGLLILCSSPIPFVGVVIYLVLSAITSFAKSVKTNEIKTFFKNIFSIQNILAVATVLPVFAMYYSSNVASSNTISSGGGTFVVDMSNADTIIKYLLFVIFEFLLLSLMLYNKKNKSKWLIVVLPLFLIPFFRIGGAYDFCMRCSIPLLFVLMIMLMDYFVNFDSEYKQIVDKNKKNKSLLKVTIISVFFVIGSITPMVEFGTSIRDYIETDGQCITQYDQFKSIMDTEPGAKVNFTGRDSGKTAFYKYIAKK